MIYAFIAALLLALLAGVGIEGYRKGEAAGANRVQVAWDKDKLAIQQLASAAEAANHAHDLKIITENEVLHATLDKTLADASASRDELNEWLLRYQAAAAARGRAMPEGAGERGPAPGSADPSLGRLDAALSAALAECRANNARFDTLAREVKPQLQQPGDNQGKHQ
jgi:hypothetical protein